MSTEKDNRVSPIYYILSFLMIGLVPVVSMLDSNGHRFFAEVLSMVGVVAGIAMLYVMCREAYEESKEK